MIEIATKEAYKILEEDGNASLIDVRQKSEWDLGYPDISSLNKEVTLIPIDNNLDDFIIRLANACLSKQSPLFFICRSGARSALAADAAEKIGYSKTYNISGGFLEWQHLGLPNKSLRDHDA